MLILTIASCSKDSDPPPPPGSNIKWKRFKVETIIWCTDGQTKTSLPKWINFWKVTQSGEEPSDFIPKPNTWYRNSGNYAYKTGTDVAPYDGSVEASFNIDKSGEFTQACP